MAMIPSKQSDDKKLVRKLPQKGQSLGGLNKLIRKIDTTATAARVARRHGSGCRRTVRTVDNIDDVEELVQS